MSGLEELAREELIALARRLLEATLRILAGGTTAHAISSDVAALLGTGFCGALTTYSTFGYGTIRLLQQRAHIYAVLNAAASGRQAFAALRASPGARAYYDELRGRGTGHHAALRQLANRLVGILHGCLTTGTNYDEHTAWGHHHKQDQQTAA